MTPLTTSSAFLLICTAAAFAGAPLLAQSAGGGPLRERLQDRVQSEIDRKAVESRAQIQQQMAARPSPAEVAQVRQAQTALNFFTFDAGPIDGVMGQQTRSAIEEYQAFLDDPVTGQLTEAQAQLLVISYQQAQVNSAQAQQLAATHPDGIKGLLLIARDGAPSQRTGVIPNFRTTGDQQTLSEFCALSAAAPGGAAPSMDQSLGPLFCNARDAAIAQSASLVSNVKGLTPAEIEEQCLGFEPALVSLVESVSLGPASNAVQAAAEFAQRTGLSPAEMSGIAKVCLGVGYRRDQPDLAIGSAVLLTALEELAYAEYIGYHLAFGFGAKQDPSRAHSWFGLAMQGEQDALSDFETEALKRLETIKRMPMPGGNDGSMRSIPLPSFTVND